MTLFDDMTPETREQVLGNALNKDLMSVIGDEQYARHQQGGDAVLRHVRQDALRGQQRVDGKQRSKDMNECEHSGDVRAAQQR